MFGEDVLLQASVYLHASIIILWPAVTTHCNEGFTTTKHKRTRNRPETPGEVHESSNYSLHIPVDLIGFILLIHNWFISSSPGPSHADCLTSVFYLYIYVPLQNELTDPLPSSSGVHQSCMPHPTRWLFQLNTRPLLLMLYSGGGGWWWIKGVKLICSYE